MVKQDKSNKIDKNNQLINQNNQLDNKNNKNAKFEG